MITISFKVGHLNEPIQVYCTMISTVISLNFGHHVIQILSNGEHPRENRPMKLLDFF